MSDAILPSFPGLTWNVVRKPQWSTVTKTSVSGREFRAAQYSYPIWRYKLTYEVLRASNALPEMPQLAAFFNAHRGSWDTWLYSDPDDNAVIAQQFGTGDGSTKAFQLVRSFGGYVEPVFDLNGVPVVTFGGQNANLVMNSSFENRDGLNRPYGYDQYNNAAISTTFTAPAGRTGGVAFGLKANAATVSTFGILSWIWTNDPAPFKGGVRAGMWQAGATYTLSFYAKKVNGAAWGGMQLGWNVPPSSISSPSNPVLTTAWQRYVFTFTMGASVEPGGSIYISVQGNTALDDEIHIDDLQVIYGGSVAAYVAGDQSYTINAGLVTFDQAPGAASALAWSGSFYWRCRFLQNHLEFNQFLKQLWDLKTLEFTTVKP